MKNKNKPIIKEKQQQQTKKKKKKKKVRKNVKKNTKYPTESLAFNLQFPEFLLWCDLQVVIYEAFLLRCSIRPYSWGTQWDSNSLVNVCLSSLLTIIPLEVPCCDLPANTSVRKTHWVQIPECRGSMLLSTLRRIAVTWSPKKVLYYHWG